MTIYSHSKLQTYEQCALKYKFKYIDKIKVEIKETIEGFLGKCVHSALEFLYQEKMNARMIDIDSLIEFYVKIWKENFSKDELIVNSDLSEEDYFNKGIKKR